MRVVLLLPWTRKMCLIWSQTHTHTSNNYSSVYESLTCIHWKCTVHTHVACLNFLASFACLKIPYTRERCECLQWLFWQVGGQGYGTSMDTRDTREDLETFYQTVYPEPWKWAIKCNLGPWVVFCCFSWGFYIVAASLQHVFLLKVNKSHFWDLTCCRRTISWFQKTQNLQGEYSEIATDHWEVPVVDWGEKETSNW